MATFSGMETESSPQTVCICHGKQWRHNYNCIMNEFRIKFSHLKSHINQFTVLLCMRLPGCVKGLYCNIIHYSCCCIMYTLLIRFNWVVINVDLDICCYYVELNVDRYLVFVHNILNTVIMNEVAGLCQRQVNLHDCTLAVSVCIDI